MCDLVEVRPHPDDLPVGLVHGIKEFLIHTADPDDGLDLFAADQFPQIPRLGHPAQLALSFKCYILLFGKPGFNHMLPVRGVVFLWNDDHLLR